MTAVRVSRIVVYPIKSTAGIDVSERPVEPRGLAGDRRWMLVDPHGECLTGREHPVLVRVRPRFVHDGLRLEAPGMNALTLAPPDAGAASRRVRIWNDECTAARAGKAADEWFSCLLSTACQLVYMRDADRRPVDFNYARPGDQVSFADGFPLLLISEASLEDLNSRLAQPVDLRRFRPNLVISGCESYAEDRWRGVDVGEVRFDGAKNCSRCELTTVDPDEGEKHPRLEPLRTLGRYRRSAQGGVYFGQNMIPRSTGTLRVGDVIVVREQSEGALPIAPS